MNHNALELPVGLRTASSMQCEWSSASTIAGRYISRQQSSFLFFCLTGPGVIILSKLQWICLWSYRKKHYQFYAIFPRIWKFHVLLFQSFLPNNLIVLGAMNTIKNASSIQFLPKGSAYQHSISSLFTRDPEINYLLSLNSIVIKSLFLEQVQIK